MRISDWSSDVCSSDLVQELRQTGRGVVEAVKVEVGNRVATLPAASFAGSGDVLVTGMTKGQLKETAEQQEAAANRRLKGANRRCLGVTGSQAGGPRYGPPFRSERTSRGKECGAP